MAYRLEAGEPLQDALRRIADEQITKALEELDDPELDLHATVHQVRKRCKKVRGLLRLVRPALVSGTYGEENRALRDAARRLSDLRDAEVLRACVETLVAGRDAALEPEAFEPVVAELRRRRDAEAGAVDGEGRLAEVATALREAHERSRRWTLEKEGADAVAGGLRRTYRRGRKAMQRAFAKPSAARFHEWRKRSKYGMYHLRLLRDAWRGPLDAREEAQHALSDTLGDEHDLAVLEGELSTLPAPEGAAEVLRGLVVARRRALQCRAHGLGMRLYADRPKAHARRLAAYVEAWRAETA